MKRRFRKYGLLLPSTLLMLTLAAAVPREAWEVHGQDDPAQPAFYTAKVLPVLQTNCYRCHGGVNHRGGLNLETREEMLKGSHHGPAVVPGHPEQSWMVKLIRHEGPADDPMNMPPAPKPKLSDADIAVVEAWVRAGAVMPPASAAPVAPAGR